MPDSIDFTLRFLMFALLHSLLAIPRVKERLRHLPWYRLAYNLLSLLLLGWMMMAWQSTHVLYLVPGIGNLLMQALQLLSLLAMLLCLRQTGLSNFLGLQREETAKRAVYRRMLCPGSSSPLPAEHPVFSAEPGYDNPLADAHHPGHRLYAAWCQAGRAAPAAQAR